MSNNNETNNILIGNLNIRGYLKSRKKLWV